MSEHVSCGGELVFHHIEEVQIKNKRTIEKEYYECQKCGQILQVIVCPSYENFVLIGKIRVSKSELWRIRDLYDQRKKNMEKKKDGNN